MEQIAKRPTNSKPEPADAFNKWLLMAFRCASLRSRFITVELDEIGIALKNNWVTAEEAVEWLLHTGLDVLPTASAQAATRCGAA